MPKKIPYNTGAVILRHEWSGQGNDIATTCTLSMSRTDSSAVIVDGEACLQYGTDWAAVPLYAAATAGETSISLDTNLAIDPRPGDRFKVRASNAGPAEVVQCEYYDTVTDVMYLERPLLHAHTTATKTDALFFTYEIDTETDIADYALNLELQVLWKVADEDGNYNANMSNSEIYVVSAQVYDSGAIKEHFRDIYPRVYDTVEPRWERLEDEAYRRLKNYLLSKGRDIDALTNQEVLRPAMIEQIYLLGAPRTDEYEYERTDAKQMMDVELIRLEQMPIWFDENQDTVKDPNEIKLQDWQPHGRQM